MKEPETQVRKINFMNSKNLALNSKAWSLENPVPRIWEITPRVGSMPDEVNMILLAREDKRIGVQCDESLDTAQVPDRGLVPLSALVSLGGGQEGLKSHIDLGGLRAVSFAQGIE